MNYRWPSSPTNSYRPWYGIARGLIAALPYYAGRSLTATSVAFVEWSISEGVREWKR